MGKYFDALRGHLLAIAFGFYACGVLLGAHLPAAALIFATLCAASAFVILVQRRLRAIIIGLSAMLLVGELSTAVAISRADHPPYELLNGRHATLEAVALERPRVADNAFMRVRIVRVETPATRAAASLVSAVALLSFPAGALGDVAGHEVTVRGRIDLPGGPRNEGEPGEREILADQGVAVTVAVHRLTDLTVGPEATSWEATWARFRAKIATSIERRLPPLEAVVLEGILWGDRGNLPAGLRQEFSDTGTVHVLTTAGLHLGIMTGFFWILVSVLPISRSARVVIVVAAAWLYAALAGLHLPTLRAATMLTAGAAALELGRGRTPSAVFAAAAFAVLLPHPLVMLSPSFSMSFACVVGIALVTPVLRSLGLNERCGLSPYAVEIIRTSIAVQIALWPMQALYFNAFTPYAIVANAVVVPLIGVIMAAGSLFCVAALVAPLLAAPLGNVVWWGLTFVINAVQFFASLPVAHVDMPPPSHTFLVLYWIGLAWLAWRCHLGTAWRNMQTQVIAGAMMLGLVYLAPGAAAFVDPRMHLDAIDVGQADCILVRAPGGHAMLVDGGGRLERTTAGAIVAAPIGDRVAQRTVMPFLLRHWVLQLDAVILTHPHGDHAGGLPMILSREQVSVVYDSGQSYAGPAYRRTLATLQDHHIQWKQAVRGVSFDLGRTTQVSVLAPERPFITGTSSDINNNSVVLRVAFGHVAILLTGDAQSEAEARLLSHGIFDLRADILKVGHHGSAYSSTPQFLAAVHPNIAIISCGLHNVFGHPSPRTLAALSAVGARIYRTDLDGGISLISDGLHVRASPTVEIRR